MDHQMVRSHGIVPLGRGAVRQRQDPSASSGLSRDMRGLATGKRRTVVLTSFLDAARKFHAHSGKGGRSCCDRLEVGLPSALAARSFDPGIQCLRPSDRAGARGRALSSWGEKVVGGCGGGWMSPGPEKVLEYLEGAPVPDVFVRKHSKTRVVAPRKKGKGLVLQEEGEGEEEPDGRVEEGRGTSFFPPKSRDLGFFSQSAMSSIFQPITEERAFVPESRDIFDGAKSNTILEGGYNEGESTLANRRPLSVTTMEQLLLDPVACSIVNFIKTTSCMETCLTRDCTWRTDKYTQEKLHPILRQHLKPLKTTGDGSCFYNALSLLYFGDESQERMFRISLAYTINKFSDLANTFLRSTASTFTAQSLCLYILEPNSWATSEVVLFSSLMLKRSINVFRETFASNRKTFFPCENTLKAFNEYIGLHKFEFSKHQKYNCCADDIPENEPLYIFHVNNNHFVALQQINRGLIVINIPDYQRKILVGQQAWEQLLTKGNFNWEGNSEETHEDVTNKTIEIITLDDDDAYKDIEIGNGNMYPCSEESLSLRSEQENSLEIEKSKPDICTLPAHDSEVAQEVLHRTSFKACENINQEQIIGESGSAYIVYDDHKKIIQSIIADRKNSDGTTTVFFFSQTKNPVPQRINVAPIVKLDVIRPTTDHENQLTYAKSWTTPTSKISAEPVISNGDTSEHSTSSSVSVAPISRKAIYDQRKREYMRRKRLESDYSVAEKERNMLRMRKIRTNNSYRDSERIKDAVAKKIRRSFGDTQTVDKARKKMKKNSLSKSEIYRQYEDSLKLGPTEVCPVCEGLWFKRSMGGIRVSNVKAKAIILKLSRTLNVSQSDKFCTQCRAHMKCGRIPPLSVTNGLRLPEIPPLLSNLTTLEERMCSPRLPFMSILSLGCDKQLGLKGSVVNVPVSINDTVDILPRTYSDLQTIPVALMRRMEYKKAFLLEVIRPTVVYEALKFLIETPLYIKHSISLDSRWTQTANTTIQQLHNTIENDIKNFDTGDQATETMEHVGTETLLFNADDASCLLRYAPGENSRPVSLVYDEDAEELSFPKIFAGQKRRVVSNLTYGSIVKSEIRNKDRRSCNVAKLFYSWKKLELQRINNTISLCLRKGKTKNPITAAQLCLNSEVSSIIKHDEGFRFLKNFRSSPAYWEDRKRDVSAMIRQLGSPTLFLTFSAAETQWPELIVILERNLNGKTITEVEASKLSFSQKSDLIRRDPITCARYFDHRFSSLFNKIILHDRGVFAQHPVIDYYYRVEFQHRGSPHIHMMVWLQGAPQPGVSTDEEIVAFVDKYITVEQATDLTGVLPLQVHRHSHTCYVNKGKRRTCRFGIPKPPMKATVILHPLTPALGKHEHDQAKENYSKIQEYIQSAEKYESYDDFLKCTGMSEGDYISALRSSIKFKTIFLKRAPNAARVNAYNKELLQLHRANMDIQFVLNPYGCLNYIINYINKSQRGMSLALRNIVAEAKRGKMSLKEKFRSIANAFINGSEICAQEVSYQLLSMRLSVSSRASIYINTGSPDHRVKLVKPRGELEAMNPDSEDVFAPGLLDHYAARPSDLEDTCLADFAAYHNIPSGKRESKFESNCSIGRSELDRGTKKRKLARIIRYRNYDEATERDNYMREQLMLYIPWRSEKEQLIDIDTKTVYETKKSTIEDKRSNFVRLLIEPREAHEEEDNATPEKNLDREYEALANKDYRAEVLEIFGSKPCLESDVVKLPKLFEDSEYYDKIRSLNIKQKEYLMYVLHHIKMETTKIYHFVSGGGGVGKSRLISMIYQSLTRYFNHIPGTNPTDQRILLCAPTGKAAHNIKGVTLHTALNLPVNQFAGGLPRLSADVCNKLSCRYQSLKLIIIDEISMVGSRSFSHIDSRLKQIFKSDKPFGGIPIIVFGDFNQLPPVGDSYVFQKNKSNIFGDLIGNPLWDRFSLFELTEIMRQKDDVPFARALNNLANYQLTSENMSLFRSRENLMYPPDAVHLFETNDEVQSYNEFALNEIPGHLYISEAVDKFEGNVSEQIKLSNLRRAKTLDLKDTYGLPYKLMIKLSARYMVTNNINTQDGLTNGAIGTLQHVTFTKSGKVLIAWICFDDRDVGIETREAYSRLRNKENLPNNLTPIEQLSRAVQVGKKDNAKLLRTQFPLVPAHGITIHKSQGSTYDKVVLHCRPRKMRRTALYVALSRATNSTGLFVEGNMRFPIKPNKSEPAIDEMSRLRREKPLSAVLVPDEGDETSVLIYHNVQSFWKYRKLIDSDPQYTKCSGLLFVETRTNKEVNPVLENFSCLLHNPTRKGSGCYGSTIFVKNEDGAKKGFTINDTSDNACLEMTECSVGRARIIVIYKSPEYPLAKLKQHLRSSIWAADRRYIDIIVGDFNINHSDKEEEIVHFITKYGLKPQLTCSENSTNGNTTMGLLFSTENLRSGYYDSVFSYHKPIWFSITK